MEAVQNNGPVAPAHRLAALLLLCTLATFGLIVLQSEHDVTSTIQNFKGAAKLLVVQAGEASGEECTQAHLDNKALAVMGQPTDPTMCPLLTACSEQFMHALMQYSSPSVASYDVMQGSVPPLEQASWPVHDGRILYCTVTNGFNDMLVQTFRCWARARAQNRLLVLRTSPGLFAEPLGKYIRVLGNVTDFHPAMYADWANKTVWPRRSQGCIAGHVEGNDTHTPPTPHIEDVVITDGAHGGRLTPVQFTYLRFTSLVVAEAKRRLAFLPRRYVAVHVRNTDLPPKPDIPKLMAELAPKLKRPFFLATDNATTLAEFKAKFGARVHSFSWLPTDIHRAIHKAAGVPPHVRNLDAVVDLVCLAHATSLYLSNPRSGYAHLASYMHRNKDVLEVMMQAVDGP